MKILLVLLLPLMGAVSCTTSTPQARIAENPGRFALLSEREKRLVEQGQVDRGMSMRGVSLAWGDPSRRYSGSRSGRSTERWVYSGSRPVVTNTFIAGYGWGGYGRFPQGACVGPGGFGYGYRSIDFGLGPQIDYVPEDRATVLFVNGRVESWERKQ
jgi:hypothetical protein